MLHTHMLVLIKYVKYYHLVDRNGTTTPNDPFLALGVNKSADTRVQVISADFLLLSKLRVVKYQKAKYCFLLKSRGLLNMYLKLIKPA